MDQFEGRILHICGSIFNVLRDNQIELCYRVYIYIYISLQIVEISKSFNLCILITSVKFTLNDRNAGEAWM